MLFPGLNFTSISSPDLLMASSEDGCSQLGTVEVQRHTARSSERSWVIEHAQVSSKHIQTPEALTSTSLSNITCYCKSIFHPASAPLGVWLSFSLLQFCRQRIQSQFMIPFVYPPTAFLFFSLCLILPNTDILRAHCCNA